MIFYMYIIQFIEYDWAKNMIDMICNIAVVYFLYDMWKKQNEELKRMNDANIHYNFRKEQFNQ